MYFQSLDTLHVSNQKNRKTQLISTELFHSLQLFVSIDPEKTHQGSGQ